MSKVKIAGHASGSGTLTIQAPDTSSSRTITLPDATGTLSVGSSIDDNGNATAITIDSSENVGIGVVPESWDSDYKALQISNWSALYGKNTSKNTFLTTNVYRDSGGYKYLGTDVATNYSQASDGAHKFYVAASGSADATISWTTAMTINNDGIITKPAQPAFQLIQTSVISNVTGDGTTYKFVGTEAFDQNADCTTTTFTAPVTGRYHFDVSVCFVSLSSATDVFVDLITPNQDYRWNPAGNNPTVTGNTSYPVITGSILADMDASDTAYLNIFVNGVGADSVDIYSADASTTFFSGYLVA